MTMWSRRGFLTNVVAGLAAGGLAGAAEPGRIRAVAFDGFVLLDPISIFALVKDLFPDKGEILVQLWLTKQFSYSWWRTAAGRYEDFWRVTGDALDFAAQSLKLDLTAETRERLMQANLTMKAWPDVAAALELLRKNDIRLAVLTNLSEQMIQANMKSAGLDGLIELALSTDRVQAYKPDPKAYRMGVEAFRLPKEEVAFAASAGWDAAGAAGFGYPTVWVNRLGMPAERLGIPPNVTSPDIGGLTRFVLP
jgi:2-haloacid dehalogenase